MALRYYLPLLCMFPILFYMHIAFYFKKQITCTAENVTTNYSNLYCLFHPQNLEAENGAYLKFYGLHQYFAFVQALLMLVPFHVGLHISKQLNKGQELTICSTYILEVAIFVVVIGAIWISNVTLNGGFLFYGINLIEYALYGGSEEPPALAMFPPTAKCTIDSSELDEVQTAVCHLTLNQSYSVSFAFLWYLLFYTLSTSVYTLASLAVKVVLSCRKPESDTPYQKVSTIENGMQGHKVAEDSKRIERHLLHNTIALPIKYIVGRHINFLR